MKIQQTHTLQPRLPRFEGQGKVRAIVKNARSRCACFWLDVANLSGSGLGIQFIGGGHIPFAIEDELHITIDTSCILFKRPIHITVIVARREDSLVMQDEVERNRVFFGCEIKTIDPIHRQVWYDGLEKLGDAYNEDKQEADTWTLVASQVRP